MVGNYLKYFEYRNKFRKQKKTDLLQIKCEVPLGSILEPLLSLPCISDLCFASKYLTPLMFAGDTNLVRSHNYTRVSSENMNKVLE